MNVATRKEAASRFPRAKITRAIREIMPKGQKFDLRIAHTPFNHLKIVRVVTPAWQRLWAGERISKVLKAVDPVLTPEEHEGIFRFSVLTPAEYQRVIADHRALSRVAASAMTKKPATKRKVARKARRVLAR